MNELRRGRECHGRSRRSHLEARKEVFHAVADHSKVARVFGYQAGHDLAHGLRRMATWAKSVGPRKPTVFDNIEVLRNLPPSWRLT